MTAKRSYEFLIGYVHSLSPRKDEGRFRFSLQMDKQTVKKSLCFDAAKRPLISKHFLSGKPTKIKNAGVKKNRDREHFAEIVLNQ